MLYNILSGISFITGLLGLAGIGGAIDTWTSPLSAIILTLFSAITGFIAYRESGYRSKAKKRKENILKWKHFH